MKDSKHKYIDLFKEFEYRANDIRIKCKVSQRNCESLAKLVAAAKPKNSGEFEKTEALKAFIASTSEANEKMIEMLTSTQNYLIEIASDCTDLLEIAKLKDRLKFQSDTIEILMNQEKRVIELRDEVRRRNQATA